MGGLFGMQATGHACMGAWEHGGCMHGCPWHIWFMAAVWRRQAFRRDGVGWGAAVVHGKCVLVLWWCGMLHACPSIVVGSTDTDTHPPRLACFTMLLWPRRVQRNMLYHT